MGSYSFSQKKSSGIFIPKNDGFIELTDAIENTSITGISEYLGYHSDQRICCYFDQTFDVRHVIMEIFSCKIIFVLTSDTVVKLDKRKVDYYLRNFSFDAHFGALDACDLLREGISNKSLNIEFLSRVLNLNNPEPTGIFFTKLLDMYLSFEDEVLVDFQYPEGIDEWTKYDEMLIKSEKQKNQSEKFWEAEKRTIEAQNALEEVENILLFEKACVDFFELQDKSNANADKLKLAYNRVEREAIEGYCELVLSNSQYPENFQKTFELEYNPENKILIIEYFLPIIDQIPSLHEVKLVKNEFKEYYLSDSQIQNLFDTTMYSITLRTIYELFEADEVNAIDAISFNGWINVINKATGKIENNCILSIQIRKNEFIDIGLNQVDPKTCFKHFKGVSSSKLYGITAIQPILQIMKNDKRFVDSHSVEFDVSTNLAAMAWEDFEHLIRELFEKEFSSNGGQVKVTQASRDGGVDAIAFDPDPIRGGKIVIQAKRYTNTVGVSAVRDLFGTVMNEGANKGILVTTSDYGTDSYEFAKGKPITLLNGANLLYLLEKHGTRAKIDIKEAKRLFNENNL